MTAEAVAAGERERTEETVGPGEGVSSRLQLHRARRPEPAAAAAAAAAGVGAGEFAFFEKIKKRFFFLKKKAFGKLSPQWVDGCFIGCYGYGASNVKAVSLHPRSFPRSYEVLLSLRCIDTYREDMLRVEGTARGLLEGRGGAICMFEVPGLDTTWLPRTRMEGDQPLA